MSAFWNARVRHLAPYVPGEQPKGQGQGQGQGKKFIKLNTNENPHPPPQTVLDAMHRAADGRLRLYPDPQCAVLRMAIAERFGLRETQVFSGNGSDEVLAFAFGAFFESFADFKSFANEETRQAKHILFPDISYSFYPVFARLWHLAWTPVPLKDDWTIDYTDYCARSGGVILANPNAPTGIAMKAEALAAIADFQAQNNTVLIVDEAYADFGGETVVPFITGAEGRVRKNILVVKTLSKSYSLAGLRVGFALGSEELIEALERMRDSFNSYTLDCVAQAGAAAALRERAYYDEITRKIIETRQRVSAELVKRGFTVLPSSANFIFIKHPRLSGEQFFLHLRENGILARHFNSERIAAFLRVTIGTDEDMDAFLSLCV
ncbi:MAG: aminotransferase class I/II-fold pyridoxal phosphate-dependent enzyme [Spirochaetaceae bacterium]|jgi:histidinol-phosphate aminotransferase|nr:aminotransferase class I/II-fold pyridoxal phosphate-dependent enzyme [Spirochaetaceae bacterium]